MFRVPDKKKKRVIISTDIANEADDPFAIMHHPEGKKIRVYENVDPRLTMSDLFSKMQLCYGNK